MTGFQTIKALRFIAALALTPLLWWWAGWLAAADEPLLGGIQEAAYWAGVLCLGLMAGVAKLVAIGRKQNLTAGLLAVVLAVPGIVLVLLAMMPVSRASDDWRSYAMVLGFFPANALIFSLIAGLPVRGKGSPHKDERRC
ncbi:hypothetical protein [Asticcacaulis sp. YBE204]|uniref:hypothetical protein n=1 Tax=Asticcacaulis sp. YBE204 TaxID=1282363 RepID=UPI0003C3C344|nr:hypothetical protein [Asticcacaulis sp. YBE204]ESQ78009.1 hypothetical protein AEYBE204_16055 [Asticcacaulis sp. YBE204]